MNTWKVVFYSGIGLTRERKPSLTNVERRLVAAKREASEKNRFWIWNVVRKLNLSIE